MLKRLALILLAVSSPDAAHACSCAVAPPCETFWAADLVFIGSPRSIVQKPQGAQVTRFAVEERLRGEPVGGELTIFSYGVGGSCDYGFQQGTRYLVHARKRPEGTWGASLCGGTAPLEDARAYLTYIRDALQHPGEGTVSGNAFVDIDPGQGVRSGGPLSNVRLVLRSSRQQFETRTAGDGTYRFEAVPAGEYSLVVELPPRHEPVPPKHIAVGKGACVRHVFWTRP